MNKETAIKENIKLPKFIDNSPCGEDLFEGKSQDIIASNITNLLIRNSDCKIIGIDGGWGSGKSNVVYQIRNRLKKEYHFFIYDAWGHQEDLQRRAILEELTDDLIESTLLPETWRLKLKCLLAKSKETQTKNVPKLSYGILFTGLAILLIPICNSISSSYGDHHIIRKLFISAVPLFTILITFIGYLLKEKGLKKAFSKMYLVYKDKQIENTTFETISEDEPTVRKFKNWMTEISTDLKDKKLVIVFDNMDRLPQIKVQELWSSIHVFFAETPYKNISVIIPFDREHIKSAFKGEDLKNGAGDSSENKCFGNDFIDKTFNVVYRVSPPIMTDWKKYFSLKWKDAFGQEISEQDNYNEVIQIYDLLNKENTPRKIIAFINEFVSIKQIVGDKIPDKYIALFIIGKNTITLNPVEEIIKPSYLDSLSFMFRTDEELPKYISALFYQIDPEKAIQVIFTNKLKTALNDNDSELVQRISDIPEFNLILENAIVDVLNVENATLALNTIKNEKDELSKLSKHVWNCLYQKVGIEEGQILKEYQKILLTKITDSHAYLSKILKGYITDNSFAANNYYHSIIELKNIMKDVDIYNLLENKLTSVKDFLSFVSIAKSDYPKYKISCNEKELDDYLVAINEKDLDKLIIIPYIKDHFPLTQYISRLEKHITVDGAALDKNSIEIVFKRYKEIKKPLTAKLEDSIIYSHFINSTENEDFYYDLLAMRISKLSSFPNPYANSFEDALNSQENSFVVKVAQRIEYYMIYSDILLNLETFNQYPLYKEIVKELTKKSYGSQRANIIAVLQKFNSICSKGEIEPNQLIRKLDAWDKKGIESTNIKELASVFFIESALKEDCKLAKHCISCVIAFLDTLTTDQWSIVLKNAESYEFKQSQLLVDYKYPQNAIDAIKNVLDEIATEKIAIPNKAIWSNLIIRLEKQGKKLSPTFKNIRDSFCRDSNMTLPLFSFFGEWLFKYAVLEKKEEALRTIFTSAVMNDKSSLELILNNHNNMIQIINAAGDDDSSDFKETIKSILENKNDLRFVEFAKSIGIEKTEELNEENINIQTITGSKPGNGDYHCTKCGQKITLDDNSDVLPPCPKCGNTTWSQS